MSLSVSNSSSSVVFDGSSGYALYGEVERSVTALRRITRETALAGDNPFVGQTVGGEAEWTLQRVRITGSDANDLATKISALNTILTGGGTITDALPGGSYPVTWTLNPSEPILPGHGRYTAARSAWEGRIVLHSAVLGEGAPTDIYVSEALASTPGLLLLGDLYGDAPARLDIEIGAGWDTAANGMRSCYACLAPYDAEIDDYLLQAEAATGWSLCTEAQAGPGASDNARRVNSSTWEALSFGAPPAGRYRIIARARRASSTTGYIGLSEDGVNAYQSTTLSGSNFILYDLGEFAADGQITLYLLGKGADYVYVDYVCLFPVEDGMASLADIVHTVDSWQLGDLPTVTDVSSSVYPAARYMTGAQLVCPCSARQLLIAACDANCTEEAPAVSVSVSYVPLYYSWRGA